MGCEGGQGGARVREGKEGAVREGSEGGVGSRNESEGLVGMEMQARRSTYCSK